MSTAYSVTLLRRANYPRQFGGGDWLPPGLRTGGRRPASGHQGAKRPAGVCAGEQAPVMEAIIWLWRTVPDIDLGRVEIDALQRLGKRHGLSGGIALGQFGHALQEILP